MLLCHHIPVYDGWFNAAFSIFNTLIDYFTESRYDHSAIIVKDPPFLPKLEKGIYVLESSYESFPDAEDGEYKLAQESIAYMGCAAVHLSQLVKELTDEQKEEVPMDENLIKVFSDWDNE